MIKWSQSDVNCRRVVVVVVRTISIFGLLINRHAQTTTNGPWPIGPRHKTDALTLYWLSNERRGPFLPIAIVFVESWYILNTVWHLQVSKLISFRRRRARLCLPSNNIWREITWCLFWLCNHVNIDISNQSKPFIGKWKQIIIDLSLMADGIRYFGWWRPIIFWQQTP